VPWQVHPQLVAVSTWHTLSANTGLGTHSHPILVSLPTVQIVYMMRRRGAVGGAAPAAGGGRRRLPAQAAAAAAGRRRLPGGPCHALHGAAAQPAPHLCPGQLGASELLHAHKLRSLRLFYPSFCCARRAACLTHSAASVEVQLCRPCREHVWQVSKSVDSPAFHSFGVVCADTGGAGGRVRTEGAGRHQPVAVGRQQPHQVHPSACRSRTHFVLCPCCHQGRILVAAGFPPMASRLPNGVACAPFQRHCTNCLHTLI